jgi:soluble lytic murein transglycosylase
MPRVFLFCAILTMAAPSSGAAGDEAFWGGMRSYRAGEYDSALVLLRHATDNPYLETFRLYYRADCLLRDSLYLDAAAEIETLFALVNTGAVAGNHRFVPRASDIYIEALAGGGECISCTETSFPPAIPYRRCSASAQAWFTAASACLAEGDSARARDHFVNAALDGLLTRADSSLFKEIFRRCEPGFGAGSDWALLGIAQSATNLGLFSEANASIDRVLARKPDNPDALLGRAKVMIRSGKPEQALRAYWRIFDSAAPVSAKSMALQEISSIEYALKQYDKAAKHYFMQGSFYREAIALDRAARIHVMRREWKKAIRAWTVLRERHRGERLDVSTWIEAGLSESVLRSWLGENAQAHAILKDIVPRARGVQNAAALFWLMKTSSSDAERTAWSDSLLRAWPRSFYASLAKGDESLLETRLDDSDAREIDALARIAADRLAMCDTTGADSAFAGHPAFRAYVDLLDYGFFEEAKATAQAMVGIENLLLRYADIDKTPTYDEKLRLVPVPGRLFKVYAEAMRHGLGALSLTILSSTFPTDSSGDFPAKLWYPVSYVDEIRGGAESTGLSPFLILAVIREESRFDPDVVSRAGAIGLMQVMPSTASWHSGLTDSIRLSAEDLRDPEKNIRAGTEYLRYLLKRFDGSVIGALASYNGGEGRMARWKENFDPGSNPLVALELIGPRETRLYVKKVLDAYSAYAAMARKEAGAE